MRIFDYSEDTLLSRIQAVCMTIISFLLVILVVGFLVFLIAVAVKGVPCKDEKETGDVSGNVSTTGLPNIDTEAALELLEKGECLGGEIEEKQFTIFICKEEK